MCHLNEINPIMSNKDTVGHRALLHMSWNSKHHTRCNTNTMGLKNIGVTFKTIHERFWLP